MSYSVIDGLVLKPSERVCSGVSTVSCTYRRTSSSSTSTASLAHATIIPTPPTSTPGAVIYHWTTLIRRRSSCMPGRMSRPCSTAAVASASCRRRRRPRPRPADGATRRHREGPVDTMTSHSGGRSDSAWSRTGGESSPRTDHPTVFRVILPVSTSIRRIRHFQVLEEPVPAAPVSRIISCIVIRLLRSRRRRRSSPVRRPVSRTTMSSRCRCLPPRPPRATSGRHELQRRRRLRRQSPGCVPSRRRST